MITTQQNPCIKPTQNHATNPNPPRCWRTLLLPECSRLARFHSLYPPWDGFLRPQPAPSQGRMGYHQYASPYPRGKGPQACREANPKVGQPIT